MQTKTNIQVSQLHAEDKVNKEQDFNILIVDENVQYRNQLASRLRLKGYYVEFATGGFHLLNMLEKSNKNFHCVLIHNDMNDMSAFEITGLVRTFKNKSELPILFLSRSASKEDIKEILIYGVNDFLQKTHEQHKVLEKINHFFNIKKANQAA